MQRGRGATVAPLPWLYEPVAPKLLFIVDKQRRDRKVSLPLLYNARRFCSLLRPDSGLSFCQLPRKTTAIDRRLLTSSSLVRPYGFWNDLQNQRAFMDEIATQLGINKVLLPHYVKIYTQIINPSIRIGIQPQGKRSRNVAERVCLPNTPQLSKRSYRSIPNIPGILRNSQRLQGPGSR